MGRLRDIANAGFYPWLEDHFNRVAVHLVGPDDGVRSRMLHPCAGEGTFARSRSNPPFMADAETRVEWRFPRCYRDALVPDGILACTISGRARRQFCLAGHQFSLPSSQES